MPIDLLVLILCANQMPKISLEANEFAEHILSDLRMLSEQLEEGQRWLILEADQTRHLHDSTVGDAVSLDTRFRAIGYANLTKSESASLDSREVQQPL